MADKPLEKILKVEQPVLTVDAEHVEVTQAPPAEEVLKVKQPLTAAEDAEVLHAKRSGDINFTWEFVQAFLAVVVVGGDMVIFGILAIYPEAVRDDPVQWAAIMFLSSIGNLIVGFYFGRTNHTRSSSAGSVMNEQTR